MISQGRARRCCITAAQSESPFAPRFQVASRMLRAELGRPAASMRFSMTAPPCAPKNAVRTIAQTDGSTYSRGAKFPTMQATSRRA